LKARLRQAPGAEAQTETMPTASGPVPTRWTLRTIRATLPWLNNYTLGGVWRVLERYGVKLRTGRTQQFSPDPAYATKEARLLACLQEAARYPEQVLVLFLDEMGFFRWPDPALNWMEQAPVRPTVAPCADNNRQWRIIGALNALSGQVTYLDNYIVGRKVVGQLYAVIDHVYPAAQHIYVVQDNWSIHSHPDVQTVLDTVPRIEPVWLPTYAHWLNPIEKLWRWLREAVLHLHRWAADWSELLARVHAFLDQLSSGSLELLHYVGLLGNGKLAQAIHSA